jgi:hypothetical protein
MASVLEAYLRAEIGAHSGPTPAPLAASAGSVQDVGFLAQPRSTMNHHAHGSFEVSAEREPPYDSADDVRLGRTRISKRFEGDLQATSSVEMISAASTQAQGSAGYVAMERVRGTLAGRSGSFVLQHSGTMDRGAASLSVTVVPDTGTGQLAGLRGKMAIKVTEDRHLYTFEYRFGDEDTAGSA